jgi:hypothetical protein
MTNIQTPGPYAEEALRLVKAFVLIRHEQSRAQVIDLTEALAGGSLNPSMKTRTNNHRTNQP